MARTRAELDQIRAQNRARLGLAGLGAGFLPTPDLATAVRSATFRTSFPASEVTWHPGEISPEPTGGPGYGTWMLSHVVRPEVEVETPFGMVRVAPYEQEPDWSPVARVAAVAAGGITILGLGWLIAKAFSK